MDDVITLVKVTVTGSDQYANEIITRSERQVICRVRSVTRAEFYEGARTGLHPSYIFILSHFTDYEGETEIKYTDWTGQEKIYDVLRTYRTGDTLEITATERIGKALK